MKETAYAFLGVAAFLTGLILTMFITDYWNIGYCMEVRTLGETRGLYVSEK
jgi:hypothetical protein